VRSGQKVENCDCTEEETECTGACVQGAEGGVDTTGLIL